MLKIIISPAKKMNIGHDYIMKTSRPQLLEKSEALKKYLQGLSCDTLKTIWKCNDKITAQNVERLQNMNLTGKVAPAVLVYEGIQYQSMAPAVFEQNQLDYIQEHLYILSGFYGILRAFDGIVPYRLEMQAKLAWNREGGMVSSLYDYWGDNLYQVLTAEADIIINLASKEYSRAIEPWVKPGVNFITCIFGELISGKDGRDAIKVKATAAKMARGSMVRYMAENQVTDMEQLKRFDRMGYRYLEHLSDAHTLVFGVDKSRDRNWDRYE